MQSRLTFLDHSTLWSCLMSTLAPEMEMPGQHGAHKTRYHKLSSEALMSSPRPQHHEGSQGRVLALRGEALMTSAVKNFCVEATRLQHCIMAAFADPCGDLGESIRAKLGATWGRGEVDSECEDEDKESTYLAPSLRHAFFHQLQGESRHHAKKTDLQNEPAAPRLRCTHQAAPCGSILCPQHRVDTTD